MKSDNAVIAVVVTYNRLELLKECIEAIRAQEYKCDILVVDNNSSDGTVNWLKQYSEQNDRMYYQSLPENIGGAGGFNIGLKWAVEHGYEYAWIMDDDCIVKNESLSELMKADKILGGPKKYGFLASVVLWEDGKACFMNRPKVEKRFYKNISFIKYGMVQINQATFVSLLFPAKTVRKFGLPIRDYFIWGDDVEYTRRIAIRGKRNCYLVGKSEVIHKMKDNIGSDIAIDDISRLDRYRLSYRNENYTYRQHGFLGVCTYLARCINGIVRILLFSKDHRWIRIKSLFRGFLQGCFFNPKVEKVK